MSPVINLNSESPVLPEFPAYGISILESRHKIGFVMTASRYEFSEVMIILDGHGSVTSGKTCHLIRKNDIICVPKNTSYFYQDDPASPLALWCLCIRPATEDQSVLQSVLPRKFRVLRNSGLSRDVCSHLRTILFEQSRSETLGAAVVLGQSLLLLSKIARRVDKSTRGDVLSASNETESIVRVRDYIAKLEYMFHETETIESVSSRLKISARSFTDNFRKITGQSRLQYINKLRLQHARYLLSETDESVASIAFACGFEDLSNFFRIFRSQEAVSPNQWREKRKSSIKKSGTMKSRSSQPKTSFSLAGGVRSH